MYLPPPGQLTRVKLGRTKGGFNYPGVKLTGTEGGFNCPQAKSKQKGGSNWPEQRGGVQFGGGGQIGQNRGGGSITRGVQLPGGGRYVESVNQLFFIIKISFLQMNFKGGSGARNKSLR